MEALEVSQQESDSKLLRILQTGRQARGQGGQVGEGGMGILSGRLSWQHRNWAEGLSPHKAVGTARNKRGFFRWRSGREARSWEPETQSAGHRVAGWSTALRGLRAGDGRRVEGESCFPSACEGRVGSWEKMAFLIIKMTLKHCENIRQYRDRDRNSPITRLLPSYAPGGLTIQDLVCVFLTLFSACANIHITSFQIKMKSMHIFMHAIYSFKDFFLFL